MKRHLLQALAYGLTSLSFLAYGADAQRQADVAQRGADVMPFNLNATTHVFQKTADGGTLQLVVKDVSDTKQIEMVRAHLRMMQGRFQERDFSGPAHIHGADMPGLAKLKGAKPGGYIVSYQDTDNGARLHFKATDADLVSAIHTWFEAQMADHGADARAETEGH